MSENGQQTPAFLAILSPMKRHDAYYEAMKTRDPRFDGKFFVGVKTTGIYCRPICPARPKRENVEFYTTHLEAERAGFRPCLRCRPESAPLSPAWIGKSAVVRRAAKLLAARDTFALNEDSFAAQFGVTARHLRRLFVHELGKTPRQLASENRLNLARKLITETSLPLGEVAFAAGFLSVRRFNDAFRVRFRRSPGEIRRSPLKAKGGGLVLSLSYRPPYDFNGLLGFYSSHAIGSLEWVEHGKFHRFFSLNGGTGKVVVANDPESSRLLMELEVSDPALIHALVSKVRAMFDLDSDPVVIANSLELDPRAKRILKKHPGIRLPSGWDPFEVAIGTILGQLVSVERGRALLSDLIELLGEPSDLMRDGKPLRFFPSPAKIAAADLTPLKTTAIRKKALQAFSGAIASGKLTLDATQDVEVFLEKFLALPGIGPWTASYVALKCLRHTDAFPETDLILARALELHPRELVNKMRPWRGYAAALFWKEYAVTMTKKKIRSRK